MELIDTHTHLFLGQFSEDIDEVIQRAADRGVRQMLLPNIDSSTTGSMLGLCAKYPMCMPMMGLHPCSVKENFGDELQAVEEWLRKEKFVAVGETGIDLYWDRTFQREQEISFRKHLEWAGKYDLPVVIHVRDSFPEVLAIVEEMNDERLRGVFHCFTGSLAQAEKIIGFGGFMLGIGGVVTFKNSGLEEVVRETDLQHILLETDSPYLAPAPYRGKRNESAYLLEVAEKIAAIKNLPAEEIAEATTRNAGKMFKL